VAHSEKEEIKKDIVSREEVKGDGEKGDRSCPKEVQDEEEEKKKTEA
jgi:hypothetical protein